MSNFFEQGSYDQFNFALSIYRQAIQAKADAKKTKTSDLVELDNWFRNDLPEKIQNRGLEAHITHQELIKTITWKLARGKFRPRLQELVSSNPPALVVEESKKAIKAVRESGDIEAGVKILCTLKGVGPALASAVLSAALPRQVPFMADECLLSIPSIGRCEYTLKEYIKYVEEIKGCVQRLNSQSKAASWTPHTVELALWAHHVASNLQPDLLDHMPSTQVSEKAEDNQNPDMSVLEVSRVDGNQPLVRLTSGGHFLGRGPLLQITDTKISRKHAKVNINNRGEAEVKALHTNPCFIREQEGAWTSLQQHQSRRITHNMEIKFTESLWHYRFSVAGDKNMEEKYDSFKDTLCALTEGSNTVIQSDPKGVDNVNQNILTELIVSSDVDSRPLKSYKDANNADNEAQVKGFRNLQKVLNKSSDLIEDNNDSLMEPESSKATAIEPEKSKPTCTKSPRKRQLPDWLLKLTEGNGVSPLRSNPKKRKLDSEDEDMIIPKSPKPAASPKRVKKATNLALMPGTSRDDDKHSGNSVGSTDDKTEHNPSKNLNKVKSAVVKNKYPVLVTAQDLQDSEDEAEKENQVKQKKDTKKVRETSRASCPHGAACYRNNPIHFQKEAHPGDTDFKDSDEVELDDDRPECEFGTNCYRKNPDHKRNFKHSHKPQPKRRVRANKKKAQTDDDLDDSFIDDDSEESIDDTDEDEDYEPELNSSQD